MTDSTKVKLSCLFVFFMVALLAMLGDGTILLNFVKFNEGWVEVGFFGFILLLSPWAFWKTIIIRRIKTDDSR